MDPVIYVVTRYFLPQIETKIMNEGWASHWHHRIMTSIDLPQEVRLEFMVRHNQVICPRPGGLNPYHVGFTVWRDIEKRFGGDQSAEGRKKLFAVRESKRDVSFLRRFLTEELCRELDLFIWKPRGEHLVVAEVADKEHWDDVKSALLRQIGTGSMPAIRIHDANFEGRRALHLVHDHDGRDLDMTHAGQDPQPPADLWGRDCFLLTFVRRKKTLMSVPDADFDAKLVS